MKKLLLLTISFLLIFSLNAQNWNEAQKIVAIDRDAGDNFGECVSLSGNDAIVGTQYESFDKGAAYIYHRNTNGIWNQGQKIVASDGAALDNFGRSVAIDGDYAVVGAWSEGHDANGGNYMSQSGSAYIYKKGSNGSWSQVQKIVASDRTSSDFFGHTVNINGDYIIVGAHNESEDANGLNGKSHAGSAYIFKKNLSGVWNQEQKIVPSDRFVDDNFGISVALSGDTAIIGAHREDHDTTGGNSMSNSGSAYIFIRNASGIWTQKQKLVASDRSTEANFGVSVSINNDYLIVGAYGEDYTPLGQNTMTDAGAAYIFECDSNGNWIEVQKMVSAYRVSSGNFGYSVSIHGNYSIVGARNEMTDVNGQNIKSHSGSAYIYERDSTGIWQAQKIVPFDRDNDDLFGNSVSISNNCALVSAFSEEEDESGNNTLPNAGSAYFFKTCINIIDTSVTRFVTTNGATMLQANAGGDKYQWLDCNNGYSIIYGDTNQNFSPNQIGNYAVEITKDGCVDTSSCYIVTLIGISENDFASSLNFYPNPTSGKVNFDLGKTYKEVDFTVRNLFGQAIQTKSYQTTNQISFEIKGTSGIYFVEIRTDEGESAVVKVVKE